MESDIDQFFIDRDCHWQSIGSNLTAYIKEEGRFHQRSAIILTTRQSFSAQAFYEKMTFLWKKDLSV